MLNAPDSIKIPEDIEKATENARANLATVHSEIERLEKEYRALSKEVVASERRMEWANNQVKESEKKESVLKSKIDDLQAQSDKLNKENEELINEIDSQKESQKTKVEQLHKWESDLKERHATVSSREEEHSIKVGQFDNEKRILEVKKNILNEVLKKL